MHTFVCFVCAARGSIGQNPSGCSVFEVRCRLSNALLMESHFGIMMREFKDVVP